MQNWEIINIWFIWYVLCFSYCTQVLLQLYCPHILVLLPTWTTRWFFSRDATGATFGTTNRIITIICAGVLAARRRYLLITYVAGWSDGISACDLRCSQHTCSQHTCSQPFWAITAHYYPCFPLVQVGKHAQPISLLILTLLTMWTTSTSDCCNWLQPFNKHLIIKENKSHLTIKSKQLIDWCKCYHPLSITIVFYDRPLRSTILNVIQNHQRSISIIIILRHV